jgi:hypothetical protein
MDWRRRICRGVIFRLRVNFGMISEYLFPLLDSDRSDGVDCADGGFKVMEITKQSKQDWIKHFQISD